MSFFALQVLRVTKLTRILVLSSHWSHDGAYFESQRRELLYKHGIDLEDQSLRSRSRNSEGRPPFDPPRPGDEQEDVEGPKSVLGWRDKHRRRMAYVSSTNSSENFAFGKC